MVTELLKEGIKWGNQEKSVWLSGQKIKRSYKDEVLRNIEQLPELFNIEKYGALSYDPDKYPLFMIKSNPWSETKRTILITGGVHGYETSGVQGAIRFAEKKAQDYGDQFNFIIAPCVSPWGYETINRWNPKAVDPNRSFYQNSPSEEAASLMQAISELETKFTAHFDLHETTDTDNTVFRPALAARDGVEQSNWDIPDGFYLVGDTENPVYEFQKAVIANVEKVTHIAPPDSDGLIIGKPITQNGVINYDTKKLLLCSGFSNSDYATTTEVYPDSPKVTDENCIEAQVAAIVGGLNYLISRFNLD